LVSLCEPHDSLYYILPCASSLVVPSMFLSILFLNSYKLYFSVKVRGYILQPYKMFNKVVDLHILVFNVLASM
jgi:hypothetical protein